MTLVVPTIALNDILTERLNRPNLKIKLFSNNITPNAASVNASFTEVSGGGYANQTLVFANWVIANGVATYNTEITFTFTGPTDAPSAIYGYWIVDEDDLSWLWAENLPGAVTPFIPIAGSTGKITPRLAA